MRRHLQAWKTRASIEFIWTWMVCLLFAVSATSYIPKTPEGVQCPTAQMQEIEVVRTVENCCGDTVQVVEKRAPLPGEEGFKQCQCAESKTSRAEKGKHFGELPVFTLSAALIVPPIGLVSACGIQDRTPESLPEGPAFHPLTPPPTFI